MNVRLIAVDKLRTRYISDACADFRKRLSLYGSFEELEVRAGNGDNAVTAMRDEGERILHLIERNEHVWLLHRAGTALSSLALAEKLSTLAHDGVRRVTFVVAGTYGASDALIQRADFRWSLSDLTFLHEWARMIVLEQVYRAAKIARNEPYHH
jgi:23S rRNA (pseudouridine1915-N3)-methyltransferase